MHVFDMLTGIMEAGFKQGLKAYSEAYPGVVSVYFEADEELIPGEWSRTFYDPVPKVIVPGAEIGQEDTFVFWNNCGIDNAMLQSLFRQELYDPANVGVQGIESDFAAETHGCIASYLAGRPMDEQRQFMDTYLAKLTPHEQMLLLDSKPLQL